MVWTLYWMNLTKKKTYGKMYLDNKKGEIL